jgi:hypothetical protein
MNLEEINNTAATSKNVSQLQAIVTSAMTGFAYRILHHDEPVRRVRDGKLYERQSGAWEEVLEEIDPNDSCVMLDTYSNWLSTLTKDEYDVVIAAQFPMRVWKACQWMKDHPEARFIDPASGWYYRYEPARGELQREDVGSTWIESDAPANAELTLAVPYEIYQVLKGFGKSCYAAPSQAERNAQAVING